MDYIGGRSGNTITILAVIRSDVSGNEHLALLTDYINISVTISASPTDHLSIQHSGSAITCAAETVIVRAHQTYHPVDSNYLNTVNLST